MKTNTIKATEGNVFRRIADGTIYDNEITLGYTYFINGEQLKKPHLDSAEDFEEISISEIEELIKAPE